MAVIRAAVPSDAPGIASAHVASWRTTYPGVVPDAYLVGLSAETSALRWCRILSRRGRGHGTLVAVDPTAGGKGSGIEDGIVGFATWGSQRTTLDGYPGEFYALYLVDSAQGQGIGRRLMAAMASELLYAGVGSAVVWVLRDNPARWFYERLGGRRIAEQPITFAGAPLTEVAYGWRDLVPLARLSADPPVR